MSNQNYSRQRPPSYYKGNYPSSPDVPAPVVEAGLAGFWPRVVATLIDGALVSIPARVIYELVAELFSWPYGVRLEAYYPSWTSQIIFWGLYAWLCYLYFNANTSGKLIMGIKLVNPDGSKPSLAKYVLHYTVGYWLNGLIALLGFIWVWFDPYKQTWGQKIFKDYTVNGRW